MASGDQPFIAEQVEDSVAFVEHPVHDDFGLLDVPLVEGGEEGFPAPGEHHFVGRGCCAAT
ncbi:MAG: hypothetical protein M3441_26315 [Chloroflexota bacterium]|nr:hypothetical protein [Chloroflexota bacterium]